MSESCPRLCRLESNAYLEGPACMCSTEATKIDDSTLGGASTERAQVIEGLKVVFPIVNLGHVGLMGFT